MRGVNIFSVRTKMEVTDSAGEDEDAVQGINNLVNLYLQAFYSYHFLSEILGQDESLLGYSRRFNHSSNIAKCNAQAMMDYQGSKGRRFVIMEPPRLLEWDLRKAAELESTICSCIERLRGLADRDSNEELLAILRWERSMTSDEVVQITEKSSRVKIQVTKLERKMISVEEKVSGKNDDDGHERSQNLESTGVEGRQHQQPLPEDDVKDDKEIEEKQAKENTLPRGGSDEEVATGDEGRKQFPDSDKGVANDEGAQEDARTSTKPTHKAGREDVVEDEDNKPAEVALNGGRLDSTESESDATGSNVEKKSVSEEGNNESDFVTAASGFKENREDAKGATETAAGEPTKEQKEPVADKAGTYTKGMPLESKSLQVSTGLQMQWGSEPRRVAVIKKLMDADVNDGFIDMILWLQEKYPKLEVMIEATAVNEAPMMENPRIQSILSGCQTFTEEDDVRGKDIDLIISLGGDGTLIHACSLFPKELPPVLGFRTGSLNFLVPFKFEASTFPSILDDVWAGKVQVNLRSRIAYTLTSAADGKPMERTALNEVALTRGCAPTMCKVDLFINKQKLAHIEGDGVLICTPTGSTAYSLGAGGAVIHPSVPCLQVVPIAPHSICTRAIVVPCNTDVVFRLSDNCRGDAVVTSDGNQSFPMGKKDTLRMQTSSHPLPLLYNDHNRHDDEDSDWLKSFHWCQQLDAPGAAELEKSPEVVDQEEGEEEEVPCKPCSLAK